MSLSRWDENIKCQRTIKVYRSLRSHGTTIQTRQNLTSKHKRHSSRHLGWKFTSSQSQLQPSVVSVSGQGTIRQRWWSLEPIRGWRAKKMTILRLGICCRRFMTGSSWEVTVSKEEGGRRPECEKKRISVQRKGQKRTGHVKHERWPRIGPGLTKNRHMPVPRPPICSKRVAQD